MAGEAARCEKFGADLVWYDKYVYSTFLSQEMISPIVIQYPEPYYVSFAGKM
jgi:hypothetical protein